MDLTKLHRQLEEAKSLSSPRTAILLGREDLLGEAVESILKAENDWHVIRIPGNIDADRLTREVEKANPEILLVLQGDSANEVPPPLHLIRSFPALKIFVVNPKNNLMEIYRGQQIWIRGSSDLLSIINEPSIPVLKGGEQPARTTHSIHHQSCTGNIQKETK